MGVDGVERVIIEGGKICIKVYCIGETLKKLDELGCYDVIRVSGMNKVLEKELDCYLGYISGVIGLGKEIWGKKYIVDGAYEVMSLCPYWNVVVLGVSDGIVVRSAEELGLGFMNWKDRKDILDLLGVGDADFWWKGVEHLEIAIDKEGGYYVVKYGSLRDVALNREIENKLDVLGLCGNGYFRLPMDSFRELMGLLG